MSEYWVSKKRYFCKYCETYIADDAPSRQHHENGMRHKGSVERFIRGIYKAGEKQKKDSEEEKREMARVEQVCVDQLITTDGSMFSKAANAAFAQDVSAGLAKPGSGPVASTSKAPRKPAPKPSNPFANYSTAESLGYTDPDAERITAELEIRRSQGVAGEWQILDSTPESSMGEPSEGSTLTAVGAGVKREAEATLEDDSRTFKLRKKIMAPGLGEIYDPGLIPIKVKKKEEPEELISSPLATIMPSTSTPSDVGLPKWTSISLKRRDPEIEDERACNSSKTNENSVGVKTEDNLPNSSSSGTSQWVKIEWNRTGELVVKDSLDPVKTEPAEPAVTRPSIATFPSAPLDERSPSVPPAAESNGSLFKKRKTPLSASRARR